ncbi:head-tail connector protein [Halalkalibacterium halodurans]|uniref:head-tail connector protein n=1 Tax=Halalkalibacterium halodurans TaxID=86665 RepID=UPI002AA98A3A|nr:head-tail connector protein [Halalkalibacterium halodurans]MDY7224658.1 head-tail connector protein [Halalkalibacterium halodurans]MDY7243235.1 head-tail connector protein [Halalkalibacterium halodurans]
MLTLENFPELKTALRIDGSEDDKVLTLLLNAAKTYLENAGIPEASIHKDHLDLYKQAILIYIGLDYEYDDRKIPKLERALQRILLQLRVGAKSD